MLLSEADKKSLGARAKIDEVERSKYCFKIKAQETKKSAASKKENPVNLEKQTNRDYLMIPIRKRFS